MRAAVLLALALVVIGLGWIWVGASVGPLTRTCSPELEQGACGAAVDAVLRRGTPVLHPLILAAHVEPGDAPGPDEFGHRATVSFTLAAMPPAADVELYFDQGAHWGGRADPSEQVVSAMALEPLLLASAAGLLVLGIARRRRPARA